MVKEGKVYDLGLTYERRSYKFAGHNPGEIISFRTPTGMLNQKDLDQVMSEEDNSLKTTFMSNALFISDNVATQIDGFGHLYEGDPPHTPTTASATRISRATGDSSGWALRPSRR
jgi:hypothetical protein